jgi:hypothetical protein
MEALEGPEQPWRAEDYEFDGVACTLQPLKEPGDLGLQPLRHLWGDQRAALGRAWTFAGVLPSGVVPAAGARADQHDCGEDGANGCSAVESCRVRASGRDAAAWPVASGLVGGVEKLSDMLESL